MVIIISQKTCEINNKIVDIISDEIIKGKLVVLPTETVYGIAVKVNSVSIERLFKIKKRYEKFSIHVSHIDDLSTAGIKISREYRSIIECLTPNPITIIIKDIDGNKVGIRIPDLDITRRILSRSGPCYMPSANRKDNPSPISIRDVLEDLENEIDIVLDCGETKYGIDSTVVDISERPIKILRIGAFPLSKVREYFHENVIINENIMKLRPLNRKFLKNIRSIGFSNIKNIINILEEYDKAIIVCTSETFYEYYEKISKSNIDVYVIGSKNNISELYRGVYSALRYIMRKRPDIALLEILPPEDEYLPVIEKFLEAVDYVILG